MGRQLGPILGFIVLARRGIDECVRATVGPFDDIDELSPNLVEQAYAIFSSCHDCVSAPSLRCSAADCLVDRRCS
jgi:hypothetical protein